MNLYESVMGSCACAILLSNAPRLAAYELEPTGVHAHDISDVIRPTPRIETGNSEISIYSYVEALVSAYAAYESGWPGPIDFDIHFAKNIYHVPFGGISWRAHRTLLGQFSKLPQEEMRGHFGRKVLPSLAYTRRIGASYGASTLVALVGLCDTATDLAVGDRVGIYAYGSGSCAEYYGVRIAADFRAAAREAGLSALLDAHCPISVDEYELAEKTKDSIIGAKDFVPARGGFGGLFETHYLGKHRLVLESVRDYYRSYLWV